MKRVAIFASYNKDGIIADYVIYYLNGLKKVAEKIIFIADNETLPEDEAKLRNLVIYSKCERHGCYDFGSYRRGLEWAEKEGALDDADELIFCNDSCYGPVFPFDKVFSTMAKRDCDFWGLTESNDKEYHIQSFFMVFRKNVFSSQTFKDFVHSFENQKCFMDYVLKYETRFTSVLSKVGFKADSFVKAGYLENLVNNQSTNPMLWPIEIIEKEVPLIKRKVFLNDYDGHLSESLLELLYKVSIINEELFSYIKNNIAENDIQFVGKLYKQDKRTHEAILESIAAKNEVDHKNKKHLKQLRWMIYVNIVLVIIILLLLYHSII